MRESLSPDAISALVLAGERGAVNEVARVAGVSCKALTPLAGVPMVVSVLNALQDSGRVGPVVLCGPDRSAVESCPRLLELIRQDGIEWFPAAPALSDSVQAGLARIDPEARALITTADHGLLEAEVIDFFLSRVSDSRADINIGLVAHDLIRDACPGARRTVLKFAEGGYCGCNLYAFNSARARDIVPFWQRIQADRKRPWRMIRGLSGFGALARYVCGRLSMEQAGQAILDATGIAVEFISLPFPRAGIDVDTPADLALAQEIIRSEG